MCACVLFFQVDEQSSCFSLDVGVVVGRRSIQVAHQSKLQVNPGASKSVQDVSWPQVNQVASQSWL